MEDMKGWLERRSQDVDDTESRCMDSVRIPGQRDPERTKRAILEAATAEFVGKGFAGASVNEIAARANVNKRMLYHYFGKKDQLYVAVLERIYASLRGAQMQLNLADLSPPEAIEQLILFTWDYYLQHPELLSIMVRENLHEGEFMQRAGRIREMNTPLMDRVGEILARGQAEGVFRNNVDPMHLYLTIASLGCFFVASRFTLSSLMGRDLASVQGLQERVRHIVEVVLGYLRP
jgi:AcrR family transcriptional regulator